MTVGPAGTWMRPLSAVALAFALGCAGTADRLVDRAGRAAEREAGERVDRGVSGAADAGEDAVTASGDSRPAAEPEPAADEARVDAGALYGALRLEGRAAVRGIVFAPDSDVIDSGSRPVLDEIGAMLGDHPDLRVLIEVHTHLTGPEDYNRELSQRRAEAVMAWLVEEYGIDAGRLAADGLGESRPLVSADTPEAVERNRRIELVRIG